MKDDDLEDRIRKRVKKIREFYTHVVVYFMVNLLLIVIWYFTSGGFPWFVFVLGGWGIGLFFHWFNVYVEEGIFGKEWEDRKVSQLMEKEKNKKTK